MKNMKKGKRILALLVSLCMVVTMIPAMAFAAEEGADPAAPALTVKAGDTVKEFTTAELEAVAAADLGADAQENRLTYSGFNSVNILDVCTGAWGPTVESLLKEAGVDTAKLADDTLLSFTSGGERPFTSKLTWGQIEAPAYYYPNAELAKGGEKATEEALKDAKKVPAIIDLKAQDSKKGNTQLSIGQQSPNDVNLPAFNKAMATGGTITVESAEAEQLQAVTASVQPGIIDAGSTIELNVEDGWIYYTLDNTEPTKMDYLYTYMNKKDIVESRTITAPEKTGTFTIKAFAANYGNKDSEVKTFTYRVAEERVSGIKLNKKTVTLAPKASQQLTAAVSPANASIKDVTWTSANKKVAKVNAKGKVTAVAQGKTTITATTADGNKKASCTVYVGPKKAVLKTVKNTKKGAVTASWKRDAKASGYKVFAATNKAFSKNVKSKLVTKNKTTKATLTKLKKGQKYYVKVRAYKTMDGKKVYGAFSAVKTVKVKK